MPIHFLVYVGVVLAVALLPGPDTAVVTKNALIHGRDAALGSAVGVNLGLLVWTLATALGVAALIRSSASVYDALRLAGAVYLIWIGARALWDSRRASTVEEASPLQARRLGGSGGLRQGMISNLANPKVGIFFTSLLPQFVAPHSSALLQMLLLGSVFVVINLVWMSTYALAAARLSHILRRSKVKATIDRCTGVILIAVGLKLATER